MTDKYVAYQVWANPSWQSGPRYSERIYGIGDTPDEAISNAIYETRDGQVWQRRNSPSQSDLRTRKARQSDNIPMAALIEARSYGESV